jgi:hypothetical protein
MVNILKKSGVLNAVGSSRKSKMCKITQEMGRQMAKNICKHQKVGVRLIREEGYRNRFGN